MTFYQSNDQGISWQDNANGAELLSVGGLGVFSDDIYYVTGRNTWMLATRRLGTSSTWDVLSQQVFAQDDYFVTRDLAVDPENGNTFYAAGKFTSRTGGPPSSVGPKIIRSTNNGSSWALVYSPVWVPDPSHSANAIMVDPNLTSRIFAVHQRYYPPITYSTDNGNSWTYPSYIQTQYNSYALAIDKTSGSPGSPSQTIYVGGADEGGDPPNPPGMLKTLDGGATWTDVYIQPYLSNTHVIAMAIDPIDNRRIYAALSDRNAIIRSVDGGSTWEIINAYTWPALMHHPNRSEVIYGARLRPGPEGYRIRVSTNGGDSWNMMSTNLPSNVPISHLAFDSKSSSSYPRYLYAGLDNGVYRIDLAPFPPGNVQVAPYNNNPRITWTENPETDLRTNPYNVYRKIVQIGGPVIEDWWVIASVSGTSYVDNTIIVLPKPFQYTIYYKLTATDLPGTESAFSNEVSINVHDLGWKAGRKPAIEVEVPSSFGLSQNMPNPFNPTTVITYQLPEDSRVTIKLYDVLGKDVDTLVDEMKAAGFYQLELNASDLSSGVYFYRMAAGKFSTIKKMVLMK